MEDPMTLPNLGLATGRSHLPALVEAAALAPSSHNTQPWRFRPDGDAIDLLADRTRALPVNDPTTAS